MFAVPSLLYPSMNYECTLSLRWQAVFFRISHHKKRKVFIHNSLIETFQNRLSSQNRV